MMLLFGLVQVLTGGGEVMAKDGYKSFLDYDFIDFSKAMWAMDSTGMPVDGPLWFIRDLFVIQVLSPLVFLFVKYLKWVGLLILGGCYIFQMGIAVPGFSTACWFFFSWGAYHGMNKHNLFSTATDKQSLIFGLVAAAATIFAIYSYFADCNFGLAKALFIIVIVALVFGIMAPFERKDAFHIPIVLSTASFWIYAIHKPIQVIIRRLAFAVLHPSTDLSCTVLLFAVPTLTVLVALFAFYLVKRYFPQLKFLNGYRL